MSIKNDALSESQNDIRVAIKASGLSHWAWKGISIPAALSPEECPMDVHSLMLDRAAELVARVLTRPKTSEISVNKATKALQLAYALIEKEYREEDPTNGRYIAKIAQPAWDAICQALWGEPEPVSVSLADCALACSNTMLYRYGEFAPHETREGSVAITKAVLDAAGVKYVD